MRALVLLLFTYLTSRVIEVTQGKVNDLSSAFSVFMGAVVLASVILSVRSMRTR